MSLLNQLIPFRGYRPARANGEDDTVYLTPAHEIKTAGDAYGLEVFVPGVARDAVEIDVDQGTLVITARRRWKAPEGWTEVFRETPDADYRLSLDLNEVVDADKITAVLEDGVLRVTLPKAEALKPRKIAIN
jgi:HSP20 family molecular chaperone IbpA